jgi:predicted transcriptional regulator
MQSHDFYDLAENRLKAFTRSAVRTKIMLRLAKEEMTAGELEEDMDIRESTILHSMKELIDEDIARKTRSGYALTNIGKIQALLMDELVSAIVILDQHKEFWLSHDLSGIPLELLAKIGMLGQSEILKGDSSAILKSHEHFLSEMMMSKEVSGVSPIILPDYPEAIAKKVRNGAKVKLIVTKTLLGIMIRDHRNLLENLLNNKNFELYSLDIDAKTAFTVTDNGLSLGFFRIDGGYDIGSDLICDGETAREWGMELFKYYFKMSNPIKII